MTKITKRNFKEALEGSLGTNRDLSVRLNVSDSAISQFVDRHPDMKELQAKRRLSNIDVAEHEIFNQLDFDDDENMSAGARIRQNASQFILTRLGKNRGWVEKTEQEIEHKGEGIKFIIEEKKPDEGNQTPIKS